MTGFNFNKIFGIIHTILIIASYQRIIKSNLSGDYLLTSC
jgi:hypothetical protein